jgi:hypothetical protein
VFEGKIAVFVFRVNVCGGKGSVIKDLAMESVVT